MLEVAAVTKLKVGCGLVLVLALGIGVASAASGPVGPKGSGRGQHGGSRSAPGYLGIDVRDVGDDEVSVLKLKDAHGAEITRVDHDGPAGKMGLREHDVVVQLNGVGIESEEQVRRLLHEIGPGGTVALVISRDGQQRTLTGLMADRVEVEREAWQLHLAVVPQAGPELTGGMAEADQAGSMSPAIAVAPTAPSKYSKGFLGTILLTPAYTGLTLERMGPQLAGFFGVPKGLGLLVKSVENNSPAQMAGVRAGDVVVRANAKLVGTMTDWTRVVRDAKGRPVTVVVLRDRQEKTLTLTPDARKHSMLEPLGSHDGVALACL